MYTSCTYKQINGKDYYLIVGCSDDDSSLLDVNIYNDADCTESSIINGYDDANIEMDMSIKFNKCIPCVIWADKNDDEIDDAYYVNKQTNAPLCSAMWEYRETCNGKCQMTGSNIIGGKEGWNKADKVLLSILSLFGKLSKRGVGMGCILCLTRVDVFTQRFNHFILSSFARCP